MSSILIALLLGQAAIPNAHTTAKPGQQPPYAVSIQGVSSGVPIPISGTVSSSGAADTVSATQTFNANSVCQTVATQGQTGASFSLAAGTLAATLTPSISADATVSSPNCTGGTWTTTSFLDVNGNTSSTLVVTNPNTASYSGIVLGVGVRCARVCTTAYTSGTANGFLVASTPQGKAAAAGADVTDRAGRLLGQLTDGASAITPTKTGQLPTALDGSGFLKTHEQGTATVSGTVTANAGTGTFAVSAASLPLPTGAAQDATLTGGTARVKLTDGTNNAAVKAASTAAAATDPAMVVAVSPNNSVAVTGTFWQATQPVSGTVTTSPPANASTNIAQINGVTPLMGNGVTGTGSQRVTIASDNTAFTVNAAESGTWTVQPGNTANTTPWLVQQSDGTTTPPVCNVCAAITASALNGVARIVTGVTAKKIYVCSWHGVGSAAVNVNLVEGTQVTTACDTGQANVTGPEPWAVGGGVSAHNPYALPYTATAGDDLCIKTSGAATIGGQICYVIK